MNLVTVQGSMQLAEPAATAWLALVADVCASTGIRLTITSPGGAWRSEEMVLDMWRNPARYGATMGTAKPRSLGGPGSIHQDGLCVDIWNWAAIGTPDLDHYAALHGFRRTITGERWHYQHNGITPAGATPTPIPASTLEEELLMSTSIRYHYKPASAESAAEFGIFGDELPGGYEVSTVEATGVAWGRLYGRPDGSPWTSNMTRGQWIRLQEEARHRHEVWLEQQRQLATRG